MQTLVSKHRNELKGFAILWVVCFHASAIFSQGGSLIAQMGYGGVEIFFFLSGFGLYHSLSKSSELSGYIKRRAKRLLPAYLPFCALWLIVMIPLYRPSLVASIRAIVGNVTMVGYFANVTPLINWYPAGLLLSLILAPFAFALIHQSKKPLITTAILITISFIAGLCFVDDLRYTAISRIPIFLVGMGFAFPLKTKTKPLQCIGLAVSFLFGLMVLILCMTRFEELLFTYGMYWHPFVLMTPPLCIGLAWVISKTSFLCKGWKVLSYLGMASFEIFLFNAWAEVLGKHFDIVSTPLGWVILSIISIALGCIYHDLLQKKTNKP